MYQIKNTVTHEIRELPAPEWHRQRRELVADGWVLVNTRVPSEDDAGLADGEEGEDDGASG